jgi:hypothetical protein
MSEAVPQSDQEKEFDKKLLNAICDKLMSLGEISRMKDFLKSYPKENLADVHNNETGAYYLMNREQPLKLVEYNLKTFEVFKVD